ncbi:MAG: HAD hydrolase-like protein [Candidatus Tectimicrobiota bacterium]
MDNVIYHNGTLDGEAFQEIGRLVQFLKARGVTPAIVANHMRTRTSDKTTLEDFMNDQWGPVEWFVASEGRGGWKPRREAIQYVLDAKGWSSEEVVYIGNTDNDMKTARSGGVLFLNATWFTQSNTYGLQFGSPKEVGRFVDLFCLREHLWHFSIVQGPLEYYALSPYSTYKPEYETYSRSAEAALKRGTRHTDFWVKYLSSSIYFSGIHKRVNYVAPYPGHEAGSGSPIIDDALVAFTNCFNISYLRDLIIRHTTVLKSQHNRSTASPLRQLNSIHLNKSPLKPNRQSRYKNPPLSSDKTVLVIDDFCTAGFSLEAARAYIERTEAKVICVSFLKTINTDYRKFNLRESLKPYHLNELEPQAVPSSAYSYQRHIIDVQAPQELTEHLLRYDRWDWPV